MDEVAIMGGHERGLFMILTPGNILDLKEFQVTCFGTSSHSISTSTVSGPLSKLQLYECPHSSNSSPKVTKSNFKIALLVELRQKQLQLVLLPHKSLPTNRHTLHHNQHIAVLALRYSRGVKRPNIQITTRPASKPRNNDPRASMLRGQWSWSRGQVDGQAQRLEAVPQRVGRRLLLWLGGSVFSMQYSSGTIEVRFAACEESHAGTLDNGHDGLHEFLVCSPVGTAGMDCGTVLPEGERDRA